MVKFLELFVCKDDNKGKRSKLGKLDESEKNHCKKEGKHRHNHKKEHESKKKHHRKGNDAASSTTTNDHTSSSYCYTDPSSSVICPTTLITTTANERIIENYVATKNAIDKYDELITFFDNENVPVKFDDATSLLTALELQREIRNLAKSFPDLHFDYESIKEVRPGEVLVDNLCARGTHTGEPYQLGDLPPIDATGKEVILDPECVWFNLNQDGKIVAEEITALGSLTGPPGFYISIGGNIPGQ